MYLTGAGDSKTSAREALSLKTGRDIPLLQKIKLQSARFQIKTISWLRRTSNLAERSKTGEENSLIGTGVKATQGYSRSQPETQQILTVSKGECHRSQFLKLAKKMDRHISTGYCNLAEITMIFRKIEESRKFNLMLLVVLPSIMRTPPPVPK